MNKQILHIAPTPFFSDRGCHIRIEGIVRCLDELGFINTVCTYHHGRDVTTVKTERIKDIKNYTQTEAGPNKYKLWADWKLMLLSIKQFWKLKPAVLHAHLHEGLLIAIIVKVLFFWRRSIIVADMQGSLTGELDSHGTFEKYPFLRWPIKTLEYFLMWAADHITCSSVHSLKKIQTEFNIDSDKISLTQDGADIGLRIDKSDVLKFKSRLGLPPKKTIVVYSGALLNSKGLVELKALIKGCSSQTDIHFLIIGYPLDDLQDYLLKESLTEFCTLTGRIDFDSLSKYLSITDIAIDPKNSNAGEGSGKMLNYLAASLPVVAFDTANNRQFLPADTVLAKSTSDLIQLIIGLHENDKLRKTNGMANEQYFQKHHSWEITKSQLEDVYQKLRN